MCGISGFINANRTHSEVSLRDIAQTISDQLKTRGPDDSGIWVNASDRVALAHQRLSIIDLSSAGHQPMCSRDDRYVLVFNGEIYNFREIKDELEKLGCVFSSHTDTEVILQGCIVWGVEKLTKKLRGMFAYVLWDQKLKKLSLVRDRLGIKPLYYYFDGELFIFASQSKGIKAYPGIRLELNANALYQYLNYKFIPNPLSIYDNVLQLKPGCILEFSQGKIVKNEVYWDLESEIEAAQQQKFLLRDELDVIRRVENLLDEVVSMHMISDVPLGVFLSGGIDSSLITALMVKHSKSVVKSFSIGFSEEEYNEAQDAKRIADHLNTEHIEFYFNQNDALSLISKLPEYYDEPFADVSQLPTLLLSQLTRQHVTVALSGDGGDECFGGYNRYLWADKLNRINRVMPFFLRKGLGEFLDHLSPESLSALWPLFIRPKLFHEKYPKFVNGLKVKDAAQLYAQLLSSNISPEKLLLSSKGDVFSSPLSLKSVAKLSMIEQMQLQDMKLYLPDDILVKTDRASMAYGLEARVPYLDHKLVEFSWRLPLAMKIRNGKGKYILRQILSKYIPKQIFERPKAGFSVPIGFWLRSGFREWGDDLLSEKKIADGGIFNPKTIKTMWRDHQNKKRDYSHQLWSLLMFQLWFETL